MRHTRFARFTLVLSILLSGWAVFAGPAGAGSVSSSVAADPVEDAPTTITLSGSADTATKLIATVSSDARACEPSPLLQNALAAGTQLTPIGGASVGPGAFAQNYQFTPASDGGYRVCTYLADSASSTVPSANFAISFVVRVPSTVTTALEPNQYETGQSLNGRVTAVSSASNRELRYGLIASALSCGPAEATISVPLTAGVPVERFISQFASDASSYRLCAVVIESPEGQRETTSEAVATPVPRDVLLERWRPVPLTGDEEQPDRLRLRWSTRATSDEDETLQIWDVNPAEDAADPLVFETLDSDRFELMEAPVEQRDTRVRNFLGYRPFWWSVGTKLPNGDTAWSAVRTVTVVPSPMKPHRVRVSPKLTFGHSSGRPGTVRLRISSSPRARVSLMVKYRGRLYAKRKYVEGVGGLRGFDFRLSCAKTGRFSYEVRMRDPYGTKAVRRGHWDSSPSRCASLRAAEQRKAAADERKRRERRERETPAPSSGGSGCHPSYTPCLKENAGDYDCAGGSGDGPNTVVGPVYVDGPDPFDLDRDGDGVGCES